MKIFLLFILVFLFYICFPQVIFASDIVINEYFPNPEGSSEISEWIEIYNTTDSEIDLTGWKIDDLTNGGSSIYVLHGETKIAGKSFYVLERSVTGLILNNDSDHIRLLSNTDQEVDIYIYSKTLEGVIYGRSTDGGSDWVEFSTPTKGSSNSSGIVLPTPTSTSVPTVEPTKAPSPSKTPTPTKSPTNTFILSNTPTSIKKPTVTNIKSSPTPRKPSSTPKAEKKVLAKTSDANPTDPLKPTQEVQVKGSMGFNPGTISLSIGGILLIGCGILLFYIKKKADNIQ